MKAIGYIRVSTEEQVSEGVSLEAQRAKVAAWADLNGYELGAIFADAGISERLDRAGADLVSLSERIDTTSAAGRMIFRMLAVLAEFERDQISERTSAAMQFKRSKGQRVGSIPYGYRLADDGSTLLAHAPEQAVITQARALRDAGLSLRKIAAELARMGFRARNGATFAAAQVQRMLLAA